MQLAPLLRTVLKLDALSCLAMAALGLSTAVQLAAPLGIDTAAIRGAAASLVPIGLFIGWLGTKREAPAMLVWLVILGNLGWAAATLAAAFTLPDITPLGSSTVAAQAGAVLFLTLLEWQGLKQSRAPMPSA